MGFEKHTESFTQPSVEPSREATGLKWLPRFALLAILTFFVHERWSARESDVLEYQLKCPAQPDPLLPPVVWRFDEEEQGKSTALLEQAVRIPTQSYDDNGEPNEDPRWAPFFDFQQWLKKSFPLAHEKGEVEYINTLGIIATFKGSDESLKPLVLMSHYDVVPAPKDTYDRWTYPPFSAHNDGTYIWGRGAADTKSLLVAQWEGITHLLESGWKPRRTVILSHGNDEEEVGARRGQGHIAPVLEERYGKDGILMLVDEGGGIDEDYFGAPFALPGMGEKGYLDLSIAVGTAGGHSSVPPLHTGIGIMSSIIAELESHPFEQKLSTRSPFLTTLLCASEHAPSFPSRWARLLRRPSTWNKFVKEFAARSLAGKAILGTTQAVDVIRGGVKVNALPELVTAQINYRVDFSESIDSTKKHVERVVRKVAKRFEQDFFPFQHSNASHGVKLDIFGIPIEPAPLTPTQGGVWDLFAGTVRAMNKDKDGKPIIVAPSASTGNTDCKVYYNLTKNVFRYVGGPNGLDRGIHTVDEHASITGHHHIVSWIHALIQNVDRYEGKEN